MTDTRHQSFKQLNIIIALHNHNYYLIYRFSFEQLSDRRVEHRMSAQNDVTTAISAYNVNSNGIFFYFTIGYTCTLKRLLTVCCLQDVCPAFYFLPWSVFVYLASFIWDWWEKIMTPSQIIQKYENYTCTLFWIKYLVKTTAC